MPIEGQTTGIAGLIFYIKNRKILHIKSGSGTERQVQKRSHMLIPRSIIAIALIAAMVQVAFCATDDNIVLTKTVTPIAGTCKDFNVTLCVEGTGTATNIPVDVILVLDFSGSMSGSPITNLKSAANSFIDLLLPVSGSNGNRVGIVVYSSSATYYGWYTTRGPAKASYASLPAEGRTNPASAFDLAASKWTGPAPCGQNQVIVFMTDGVPNVAPTCCQGSTSWCNCRTVGGVYSCDWCYYSGSWHKECCETYPTVTTGCCVQAAVAAGIAAQAKATVFSVGFYNDLSSGVRPVAEYVVRGTQNGGYWETTTSTDLTPIFNAIANQLQPAAKDALVHDYVHSNFNIIAGSIKTKAGSANAAGNTITWENFDVPFGSSKCMSYNITPASTGVCGDQIIESQLADINYQTAWTDCRRNDLDFPAAPHVVISCLAASITPAKFCVGGTDPLLISGTPSGGILPYTHLWTDPSNILTAINIMEPTIKSTTGVGSYSLTYKVTDSRGCTATDTKTIEVLPRPTVVIEVYEGP